MNRSQEEANKISKAKVFATESALCVADDEISGNSIVICQPDETTRLEVRMANDTVWLTQGQTASLFQRDRTVVTRHINNVFAEGELDKKSYVLFFAPSFF